MVRSTQDHRTTRLALQVAQTMAPVVQEMELERHQETVLHEHTGALQHYQVVDMRYEGRPARVLFSGKREVAQSGIAQDNETDLLFDYNQRFFELVTNLQPGRVLVIGGGIYSLPQALIAAFPKVEIDVIELDPDLDDLARRYFGFVANPRMRVIHDDGKDFLKHKARCYDLIIIDVFEHATIPAAFLTKKFVKLVDKHLTSSGAVASNLISAYYGRGNRLIQEQYQNYRRIFPSVDIFPAGRSLASYWLSQNFILVAQKSAAPLSLQLRYPALEPPEAPED